jgi:AcrR family transcriptional regulator
MSRHPSTKLRNSSVTEIFLIYETSVTLRYAGPVPTGSSTHASEPSLSDRRRARTRRQLLDAARELFAEQGVGETRIGQITERADVGAGSFYNYFSDKAEIVEAVVADVAEQQRELVVERVAGLSDPATTVAFAHRHFVRLALTDPTFARLIVGFDPSHRLLFETNGPKALRDIQRGMDSGRFKVESAEAALFATAGALIGTLIGIVRGRLGERADEAHAATVLRMLGVPRAEAARIAAGDLG